jgi:Holliday junction resolvase RusA-like endonuclease
MATDWFLIEGINPEPWEAPQASVGRRKGGTFVQFHITETMRSYKEALQTNFRRLHPNAPPPRDTPCEVRFFFWRLLVVEERTEHGKVRGHVADATNLQKATEDAFQGLLYTNDRLVVDVRSRIMEQGSETLPQILVAVRPPSVDDEVLNAYTQASELHVEPEAGPSNTRNIQAVKDVF